MARLQIRPGQDFDPETRGQRLTTLFLHCLPLARVQCREKVLEVAIAVICPMKLLTEPLQKSCLGQCVHIRSFGKIDVHRRNALLLG